MKKLFFLFFICSLASITQAQHPSLQTLINQKRYQDIIKYAANLNKSDSSDIQNIYIIGQAYEGMLKYKEAYQCYLHCLSSDTTRIDLLNTIARTAAYIGKARESELYFHKVLEQDSTDFYANYQLARLYMQASRYTDAMDRFFYLLEQDPDNPVILRNIGDCYNRTDQLMNASTYYTKAFQNNKENASAASTLVNTLLLIQEPEAALTICDTALSYSPANRLLLQSKAIVLFTLKDYTQADEIYTKLVAEGDSTYKTLKYGAISRYYAGKYLDSIEPLEYAFRKDTTATEVCMLLGSALGRTYDRKRAFELFDYAEQLLQPAPLFVNMLKQFRAETFARDGQLNNASVLYYELWNSSKKTNHLEQIWQLNMISDLSKVTDEVKRQRCLFINVLLANEYIRENKGKAIQYFARKQLEQFHEDMFFRGVREHILLAPDNKKTTITLEKLNELIQQLPDKMPEEKENISSSYIKTKNPNSYAYFT
ncbi:MAG: hypothetical protein LBV72_06815 [Tannerella sp.]|jgi:tetratricopeptide (TPR) repeat protein|nr:hypothetical protein [Tannerella sp.]